MAKRETGYSESMNRLIDRLAWLPGIGRRTAERLAFHLLKADRDDALALARAITDVKTNVRYCSTCFNLTESDPCGICCDPQRNAAEILVVEQPRDVVTLEQTHAYRGVYHVLLGHLSPLEGVGPGDLTVDALVDRVGRLAEEGRQVEVILGTNPNLEGDGTALLIAQRLAEVGGAAGDPGVPGTGGVAGVKVSRLARGLPAGTQIEYANKAVLSDAIVSRQPML
jgi:recombination protein RecR